MVLKKLQLQKMEAIICLLYTVQLVQMLNRKFKITIRFCRYILCQLQVYMYISYKNNLQIFKKQDACSLVVF